MKVSIHIKKHNTTSYEQTGVRELNVLPRQEEFISLDDHPKIHFQIVAVHHRENSDMQYKQKLRGNIVNPAV
jgi:hypothetical protein